MVGQLFLPCFMHSSSTVSPLAHQPINPGTPTLLRRMACWLYEGLLLFGVVFMASLLFAVVTQNPNPQGQRYALMAFLFVVLGVYCTWFWVKGQTLAMKTWRIQVVGHSGEALSYRQAWGRYLLCWVWFAPPLAVSYVWTLGLASTGWLTAGWVVLWATLARLQPQRQFWHDAWAGTRLVNHPPFNRKPQA